MSVSRAKGTAWETAIVRYLTEHGYPHAERRALHGHADKGDIAGLPGVVLEAKAAKQMALSEWLTELEAEIANARAATGAVVVKRRQRQVKDAYAVLPFGRFVELLKEAGY